MWLFIVFIYLFPKGNEIITDLNRNLILISVYADETGELYGHLMLTYNKNVRPVRNNSDIVPVKLGLKLIQIADVVRTTYSISYEYICFIFSE
jgi:hypothetical protein